jgi:hypothetical protein
MQRTMTQGACSPWTIIVNAPAYEAWKRHAKRLRMRVGQRPEIDDAALRATLSSLEAALRTRRGFGRERAVLLLDAAGVVRTDRKKRQRR